MNKGLLNNKLYNLVPVSKIAKYPEIYDLKTCACEVDGMILPYRTNQNSQEPGVIYGKNHMFAMINYPDNPEDYKGEIIDYSNASSIQEIMKNNDRIRDISYEIVTSESADSESIRLPIWEDDSPELAALKEIINAKNAPIHLYKDIPDDRGNTIAASDWNNIMRLLMQKGIRTITLSRFKTICKIFDIGASMTFYDANDSIPNPSNRKITADIITVDAGEE